MKTWVAKRFKCFVCGTHDVVEMDVVGPEPDTKMLGHPKTDIPTAFPFISHGASTRIGQGSPVPSEGENRLSCSRDEKSWSRASTPLNVYKNVCLEEEASQGISKDGGTSVRDECVTSPNVGMVGNHSTAQTPPTPGGEDNDHERTLRETNEETTKRLDKMIDDWGREQTGPDIVSIAHAYVGIQNMAREEALNYQFAVMKHEAVHLRPESAGLFMAMKRSDLDELNDMPIPRHTTA